MAVYKTACRGCHGGCVFNMTVEDGKVVKAEPAQDGPLNRGRGCMKGRTIIEQMYHPDRLLYPQKRIGNRGEGKWERISWDEAYDIIAEKMNGLIEAYGPECISTLTGTGRHHLPYLSRFANAIGTPNASTAGGLICLGPRRTAAAMTSGLFCGVDYYGPTRPGGILVWGANPAISGADGELQWLIKDAVQEEIPIVVVDPKPTELAKRAKIWLKIRPGTDAALALGILNILISENLYDHDFVENYTRGFEELKQRCMEYPLERVSEITWIPKEQILAAAHWIAETKPLGLEQGCAFEQTVNSMSACRAIIMIPAITGNYDVPGGFVESMEIAPAGLPLSNEIPQALKDISLSGGYPFTEHDTLSHPYLMLEAIRTGKPYKIRGLFIHANNTLLSMADAKHTRECLMNLDFLVYMDVFMNPTAELADIVLPAALWPEVDCVFAMPEFGDQVLLSQQKLVQVGACKMDETFFMELCQRAGWNYGYNSHREILEEQIKIMHQRRPELCEVTLDNLREKGYIEPERTYYNYRHRGFDTPSKLFEFKSTVMEMQGHDPLPSWQEPPETPVSRPELSEAFPLILTTGGRQHPYFISNNRQIRSLRRAQPFPRVRMSPKTAGSYGLRDGDWAYIETKRGRITQKVLVEAGWDDRVVNCDFAWWYPEAGAPGYGWDESNVNVLTWGDAPYDRYLGSYQFRGLLCRIYKNDSCQIEKRYYESKYYLAPEPNESSDCIAINPEKCILCGGCVETCRQVQGIGALKIETIDGITKVVPTEENSFRASGCVGCGQCRSVCPTGAMEIRSHIDSVLEALQNPDAVVIAQIAPAVRTIVPNCEEKDALGTLVGALKTLGFNRVYDTTFGADMTVRAESEELQKRLEQGENKPLYTSCCPAWVQYLEEKHPSLATHISTCRSPHQMLGAVIRRENEQRGCTEKQAVVSIMPCTAKKAEILRPESMTCGKQDVDYVLTAEELLTMLRKKGISLETCQAETMDEPFVTGSGSGTLFGGSGGVGAAVLRYLGGEVTDSEAFDFGEILTCKVGERYLRMGVVSGLGNAERLLKKLDSGELSLQLVEVMACPGGCAMGGGQPVGIYEKRRNLRNRQQCLTCLDEALHKSSARDNQKLDEIWNTVIRGNEAELLHRNLG